MAPRATRIVMPEAVKAGEIVRARCLIQHPMITGHTAAGAGTAPRQIINTLDVKYNGADVFRADYQPGIAANPYVAFAFRAEATGDVVFTWTEDGGAVTVATRRLTVTS
ncbi:MAG: thiosulfate oxidation carrier complex protein SoxZ [Hyphomicrobiaceae bacterium]|nr:thiosulfate oxidation carrier complex protein SoxZ [Hyphomicrobiaceae bacterium]